MRIFILLGHTDSDTLSGHVADTYELEAKKAGHDVRRINIGDLGFDPVLEKGYKVIQKLEPDLVRVQEYISWCEHFVCVYPNWWGGMPALLKGMWDRMFMPHFAFCMWPSRMGWRPMLAGRTARVFILCGNLPLFDHLAFGDFSASIKSSLLWFAGFRTWVTALGPTEKLSSLHLYKWDHMIARLAQRGR